MVNEYRLYELKKRQNPEYLEKQRTRARLWWQNNRDKQNNKRRFKDDIFKSKIFNKYGGAFCANCNDTNIRALHIDHIEGNGNKHRKRINKVGRDFYKWIIDNDYPPGYRVLCANCNWLEYLKLQPALKQNNGAIRARRCLNKLKTNFMALLGGKCRCGVSDLRVLTVHHINNNGAHHRRLIANGKSGYSFYRKAIKDLANLDDLECRCFSCNCAERA